MAASANKETDAALVRAIGRGLALEDMWGLNAALTEVIVECSTRPECVTQSPSFQTMLVRVGQQARRGVAVAPAPPRQTVGLVAAYGAALATFSASVGVFLLAYSPAAASIVPTVMLFFGVLGLSLVGLAHVRVRRDETEAAEVEQARAAAPLVLLQLRQVARLCAVDAVSQRPSQRFRVALEADPEADNYMAGVGETAQNRRQR